jgi:serine/threonine protein phosphatase PrpC
MNIQNYFKKSPNKIHSEDAYFIIHEKNTYGVMDGATPVVDFKNKDGYNGAYLASNIIKNHFENLKKIKNIKKEVHLSNKKIREAMIKDQIEIHEKHHLWCSCIAAFKLNEETFEYVQSGDCMLYVVDVENNVKALTIDTVKGINNRAKRKRELERENGIVLPEENYYENEKNSIIYMRSMANTKEGYSVLNGMEEAENFIQWGEVSFEKIKHIVAITDGMFYPGKSDQDMIKDMISKGMEHYADELEEFERKNDLKSDDKTGIIITL